MRSTKQLRISSPATLADKVKDEVTEGQRPLQDRGAEVAPWPREQLLPTYHAYMTDPSRGIPIDDVFDGLETRYRERRARMG